MHLVVDFNKPPVMDVNQIMDMLPHRPPFLLVDKILRVSDYSCGWIEKRHHERVLFPRTFPWCPSYAGFFRLKSMAQAGGVFVLSTVPDPENYLTFFMKIDNVKFKRPVYPGDTLIFKLRIDNPDTARYLQYERHMPLLTINL